jgi:hypothetical protein
VLREAVAAGADIGIVGDWLETARLLTDALSRELAVTRRGDLPPGTASP